MSAASDVWGYITGVISILALFCQLVRMNLPSSKLKKFDSLLQETEDVLQETDEEGWLRGGHFVQETKQSLGRLREAAKPLRSRVHRAKTIYQQCMGTFTGLSSRLSDLCSELKELKAEIVTKTDEAKEFIRRFRLEEEESLDLFWQEEDKKNAAALQLSNAKASNSIDGRDARPSQDQDSLEGYRGSGNEGKNMTLMGVGHDMARKTGNQALMYDENTRGIKIAEEACSTGIASDISYPPKRININTVSSGTM